MNNFRANFALFVESSSFFLFGWFVVCLFLCWPWLVVVASFWPYFWLLSLLYMCILSLIRPRFFFIVLFYLLVLLPFCLYCVKQIENCNAIELRKRIFFIWSQCNIGGWSVISYIAHSMWLFLFPSFTSSSFSVFGFMLCGDIFSRFLSPSLALSLSLFLAVCVCVIPPLSLHRSLQCNCNRTIVSHFRFVRILVSWEATFGHWICLFFLHQNAK